ncbi:MAG: proton-conducting transporter membrane subunit, partial [Desulfobacterales bacterium]
SFTMIVGSFFAIGEDNLKRRLAYSTISQLSYILFGAALLSPYGIKGAMVHIPFHGFMKITLFLCAGAVMAISGKKLISQLSGIGWQMPITMVAFGVGAAGMCGIPPIVGFTSKWFLCLGSVQSGHLVFLGVVLISSLLDVIYFFPIVKTAFFDRSEVEEGGGVSQAIRSETAQPLFLFMVVPLAITAVFSIVFYLFPGTFFILDLADLAVNNLYR